MLFRFTLLDRFDNATWADEPLGWEAFTMRLKRHAERHGTFREIQGNNFKFHGKAAILLKNEYELHGIRGQYRLLIEENCNGVYSEAYLGKINFGKYKFDCGTECFVSVDLDQIGPLVQFINRFDQKVDLSSEEAFDGVTPLTAYTNLTKEITLPSKAILLRGISKNSTLQEFIVSNDSGFFFPSGTGLIQGGINLAFQNNEVNAIKDYNPPAIMDYYVSPTEIIPELIYNNPVQDLNCTGTQFDLDLRVKGRLKNLLNGSGLMSLTLNLRKGTNTFQSGGTQIQGWLLVNNVATTIATYEFDATYQNTVTLLPGEKLWLTLFLSYQKNTNFTTDVRIELDTQTFFEVSMISRCDPSTAKLYMINETASRVIESITDGSLKLYSDYYGRKDSQPFSFANDGCGSMRALGIGLDIRKAKLSDGTDPKMFLSMKEIFESLSAIDNVGIGNEGEDKIRIENWKFFYQDTVIHSCIGVDKIEKFSKEDENWSVFKNGYEKWEAEDYNGLDEFLTKREWRTSLSETQNPLEKISKMIASGYAWEVTRRRQNDSKDWRFDNDKFIICLTHKFRTTASFDASTNWIIMPFNDFFQIGDTITISGTASNNGTYTVNGISTIIIGMVVSVVEALVNEASVLATFLNITNPKYRVDIGNILNPANILDPDTVYNFEISPARNALRWFDRIAQCYRNIDWNNDEIIFSSGDGNYLATGLLDGDCVLEDGPIPENMTIAVKNFSDKPAAQPIIKPERVKYTFPLSIQEYKNILTQPLGLIYYENDCESGEGWIDEIEHLPKEGTGKFTLIPKTNY
jgi:hypothetical protein